MESIFKFTFLVTLLFIAAQKSSFGQACRLDFPGGTPTLPWVSFLEDLEVGTLIGSYTSDIDSLTIPESEYVKFTFDETTRILSLELLKSFSDHLDSASGDNYLIYSFTAKCETGAPFAITLTIEVVDINNRPPVFKEPNYMLSIQTPWPTNIPINIEVPIWVTDMDFEPQNAQVEFSTDSDIVEIESNLKGDFPPFEYDVILSVKNGAQFTQDTTFTITANDGIHSEAAIVQVNIEKLNIHPPQFNKPLYTNSGKISWPPTENQEIEISINVNDYEDSTFGLLVGGEYPDLVQATLVGDSVKLAFKTIPVDLIEFDETNGVAVVELVAREIEGIQQLESKAIVMLVFDTNTDACKFNIPGPPTLPRLQFREDSKVGTVIGTYTSTFVYLAVPAPDYVNFTFNKNTGTLSLELLKPFSDSLDARKNILSYPLTAICIDDTPFTITLSIEILDINNRPTVFNEHEYTLFLQTPWPTDYPINILVPITTTDTDFEAKNAQVIFSTDNDNVEIVGNPQGDFSLSPFKHDVILSLKNGFQFTQDTTFSITATNGNNIETSLVNVKVNSCTCPAKESRGIEQKIKMSSLPLWKMMTDDQQD